MRLVIGLCVSTLTLSAVTASPSQAIETKAKITKPSAPSVVSVTSSVPKKGKVNVTVTISLPVSNGGSTITGSKVSASGKSCTIKKLKTSCTIKGIKNGKSMSVTASSKNKKGFGSKSSSVSYRAGGTAYAGGSSGSSGTFGTTSPTGASGGSVPSPQGTTGALTFNLENATGIGLIDTTTRSFRSFSGMQGLSSTPGTQSLQVTKSDGTISNAIATGSAVVSSIVSGPNQSLYLLLSSSSSTVGGVSNCVVAVVTRGSANPTCLDPELTMLVPMGDWGNKNIQFDASGAIYYLGWTKTNGPKTLRKNSNGQITDLITDQIGVTDFYVIPDGTVFMIGTSTNTGSRWLRKLSPEGVLSNVSTDRVNFIRQFADGNLYYGVTSSNLSEFGVRKIQYPSLSVDSQFWISDRAKNPVNAIEDSCANWNRYFGYCAATGTAIMKSYNFLGAKTFVTAGWSADSVLMKYWPTVETMNSNVHKVTVSNSVGESILMSGLNQDSKNITTIFNTGAETETLLLGPSNETEIYHLEYSAASNRVLFDGLRFADNKYVFGYIELGNLNVEYFTTMNYKWAEFKTFN